MQRWIGLLGLLVAALPAPAFADEALVQFRQDVSSPADDARTWARDEAIGVLRPARPDWGLGPLDVHDEHALTLARLALGAGSTCVLEPGRGEVAVRGDLAQTIYVNEVRDQVVDCETVHAALTARFGLLPRLEGMLEVPLVWRWEGALDHMIREVEGAVGDPRVERKVRPDNAYLIRGLTDEGDRFDGAAGVGLGKVRLGAKVRVLDGAPWSYPAVAVEAVVALPTASQGFGSSGVDVGLRATVSKRFGDFVLYGGGGGIFSGGNFGPIHYTPAKGIVFFATEYEIEPWLALIYQGWIESATTRNLEGPEGLIVYQGVGFKLSTGRFLIEVGAFENGGDVKRSADVIFHFLVGVGF